MIKPKDGPFAAVAIAGIPGAGKSTLAAALHEALGWPVLSTGDIARRIDPESIANGGVADPAAFADAFRTAWSEAEFHGDYPVVLDGIPRYREQVDLLPDKTVLVALTCRPDIAIDRQLRRGRPGDEDRALVEFRTRAQGDLLAVEQADGWLYTLAGWGAVVNTSQKSGQQIAQDVIDYLSGTKREAF